MARTITFNLHTCNIFRSAKWELLVFFNTVIDNFSYFTSQIYNEESEFVYGLTGQYEKFV